jgi:hypothetical protein
MKRQEVSSAVTIEGMARPNIYKKGVGPLGGDHNVSEM